MDREEMRTLLREELAQAGAEDARGSGFFQFLRHPLTLTVVGFALTTLLGTLITQTISDRAERQAEIAAAQEALADFTSQMHAVRLQQDYLLRTLIRGAPDRAVARAKARYDTAYLDWITNRSRNHFKIRTFFGFTNSNFAEQIINRTIHQDFRKMDDCLADLTFDPSGDPGQITGRVNSCIEGYAWQGKDTESGFKDAATRRSEIVFQCIRDISDTLNLYIARDLHCGSSSWRVDADGKSGIGAVYEALWEKCGFGDKKPFQRFDSSFGAYCTMGQDDGLWSRIMP